jgi:uncharacterized coiled-coil protein SlyX
MVELEIQLLHLQRHVEQLDEVVRELGITVERQSRTILKLENSLREFREKPAEFVDLLEEKPPHY